MLTPYYKQINRSSGFIEVFSTLSIAKQLFAFLSYIF